MPVEMQLPKTLGKDATKSSLRPIEFVYAIWLIFDHERLKHLSGFCGYVFRRNVLYRLLGRPAHLQQLGVR